MRRARRVLCALVCITGTLHAQRAPVLGTWNGRSVCTIPSSPCTTETVVYDILPDTSAKHDPARLVMNADKIVNGAREFMGTLVLTHWRLYRRIEVVRQRATSRTEHESVRVLAISPGITATIVAPQTRALRTRGIAGAVK